MTIVITSLMKLASGALNIDNALTLLSVLAF